jgi:hypothetical protein
MTTQSLSLRSPPPFIAAGEAGIPCLIYEPVGGRPAILLAVLPVGEPIGAKLGRESDDEARVEDDAAAGLPGGGL